MAELWLGKKGSFTEESDGETAGVLILLAATVYFTLKNREFSSKDNLHVQKLSVSDKLYWFLRILMYQK